MIFKKKFFLDLGAEGEPQTPVRIAPPAAAPAAEPAASTARPAKAGARAAETAEAGAQPTASSPASTQTTAEAMAAELAAAQASRPAPTLATFAPDCVTAGGSLPQRRRRGGADLGGFREMARGMMRS